MPLRDKTINPILEKACGLSSEPVLYPVTHVFVRCKTMCANIFLQLSKCVKIALGEIYAVGRMLKRFPTKSLNRSPHGISCAIPVHANMTFCVRCKEQARDNKLPVLLLLQQSKSHYLSMFFFTCLHY